MNNRPCSIAEVAERAAFPNDIWAELKDLFHELKRNSSADMIAQEPIEFADRWVQGEKIDAYLAACAGHLAQTHLWSRPGWIDSPERFLHHPWFVIPGRRIRILLIHESPPAFRERNIFVSSNVMDVV